MVNIHNDNNRNRNDDSNNNNNNNGSRLVVIVIIIATGLEPQLSSYSEADRLTNGSGLRQLAAKAARRPITHFCVTLRQY